MKLAVRNNLGGRTENIACAADRLDQFRLAAAYCQALFGVLPIRDPTAHLLAGGFAPVAESLADIRKREHAAAIITTNYALTGWIAFFAPDRPPVIQLNEPLRWLAAPSPPSSLLVRPMLYVSEPWRDQSALLKRDFARVIPLSVLKRRRRGGVAERYRVYLLCGWKGRATGRITN